MSNRKVEINGQEFEVIEVEDAITNPGIPRFLKNQNPEDASKIMDFLDIQYTFIYKCIHGNMGDCFEMLETGQILFPTLCLTFDVLPLEHPLFKELRGALGTAMAFRENEINNFTKLFSETGNEFLENKYKEPLGTIKQLRRIYDKYSENWGGDGCQKFADEIDKLYKRKYDD